MSNPFSSDGPADLPDEEGAEQEALDAINAVLSWYGGQLLQERRSPTPDTERMAKLQAEREKALEEQAGVESADEEEQTRIAERYAALLRELQNS